MCHRQVCGQARLPLYLHGGQLGAGRLRDLLQGRQVQLRVLALPRAAGVARGEQPGELGLAGSGHVTQCSPLIGPGGAGRHAPPQGDAAGAGRGDHPPQGAARRAAVHPARGAGRGPAAVAGLRGAAPRHAPRPHRRPQRAALRGRGGRRAHARQPPAPRLGLPAGHAGLEHVEGEP